MNAVADLRSLGIIGYILGVATAVVIGVGGFVVQGHMSGRYVLDDSSPLASLSTTAADRR
jgi:hypothetical protein